MIEGYSDTKLWESYSYSMLSTLTGVEVVPCLPVASCLETDCELLHCARSSRYWSRAGRWSGCMTAALLVVLIFLRNAVDWTLNDLWSQHAATTTHSCLPRPNSTFGMAKLASVQMRSMKLLTVPTYCAMVRGTEHTQQANQIASG